jgi:hypothetical protein
VQEEEAIAVRQEPKSLCDECNTNPTLATKTNKYTVVNYQQNIK